jgi:hypothetical protein
MRAYFFRMQATSTIAWYRDPRQETGALPVGAVR